MPHNDRSEFTLRVCEGVGAFTRDEWSKLTGTSRQAADYNPFLSHAFLSSLEDSGCVAAKAGWLPQFLRLESPDGSLLGAMPCYLKSHSQGEYVFDHGWADAFERAGGRYYPKLQASIPFTPATGPRLLVDGSVDAPAVRYALVNGLQQLTRRLGVSSAHVTFVNDADLPAFTDQGFLHRTDQQFHFFNEGYADYEEFLEGLASRKRKALRRERREALADDIEVDRLTGADLTEKVWDDFYAFYMDTGSRKWGRPYLNRRFYALIGERMPDDILLVMARRNGRYIAGAINFIGSDRLFGRNWGCIEDHRFLHFEVCYHQAIDFALERRLRVVEAGAQGEHKLARGYLPVTTHSVHYIEHEGLRRAVSDYLEHERADVAHMSELLNEHSPFRKQEQ
ncbi:GNAT family N-acetyltransferase [Phyllobacterium sp. 0TCS1.6C]|uniref:GNAT family N-acetyltransferase n=1 Tax=unclassified Phyllobacterium TaxID=2638441 RepID=UPI00226416BA|nr:MULTISPECIES: GNAT family N-acetyltransferase [unclassified Phyllobacterium]MCX8280701.1 GNAT family N-acetyltransferase [Phyllobacterium sp. 0TCS1.6C]MCX8292722.1 GNAT family N-acetyltransferase [Phyllobacterium sp. 0TCS1.6A]